MFSNRTHRVNQSFNFANPDILSAYMADITINEEQKTSLCKLITNTINNIFAGKSTDETLDIIFSRLNKYSSTVALAAISATRNYLKSRHFQFDGKYSTKSWFWGGIKFVTEDPQLTKVIDRLDRLLTVYKAKLPNNEKGRHFIQWTSWKSLKQVAYTLLLISGNYPQVSAQGFNQNAISLNILDTTFSSHLSAYFSERYDIFTSASSLEDVQIYFLGESHSSLSDNLLKVDFINAFGTENDMIFFEGIQSMKPVICKQRCILKSPPPEKNMLGLYRNEDECLINAGFEKFDCYGSDDMRSFADSEKFDDITKLIKNEFNNAIEQKELISSDLTKANLNTIIDFYKKMERINQIFNASSVTPPKISTCERMLSKFKDEITDKNLKKLMKEVNDWFNESMKLYEDLLVSRKHISLSSTVTARNQYGIIKTLEDEKVKGSKQKKFFTWGLGHFFTLVDGEPQLKEVEEGTYQYELRKHLEDMSVPYAILIPKG